MNNHPVFQLSMIALILCLSAFYPGAASAENDDAAYKEFCTDLARAIQGQFPILNELKDVATDHAANGRADRALEAAGYQNELVSKMAPQTGVYSDLRCEKVTGWPK